MTRMVSVLNQALGHLLRTDGRVRVFGESIEDPYGGAFKVTKGLSSEFPARVFDTPISEAGLAGFATGMALRGLRPVVEVMFGDFLTLTLDQVVNGMTKFRAMFGRDLPVPVVIRTPMGGYRGYGATHSQCLEKVFCGWPHLSVIAPSAYHDAAELLSAAVLESQDPTVFVEHKLLYQEVQETEASLRAKGIVRQCGTGLHPTVLLGPQSNTPARVSIVTYGYLTGLAVEAAQRLAQDGVATEIVAVSQLWPLDVSPLVASADRTGRLVLLEEGTLSHGWTAEVACRLHEARPGQLEIRRCGARDEVLPSHRDLELRMLPSVAGIEGHVLELL